MSLVNRVGSKDFFMPKTKKAFNTDTIDCSSWDTVIASLEKAVKRQRRLFKDDIPADIFKPGGVDHIPLTASAWRRVAKGIELEPCVKARWFPIYKRNESGGWDKQDINPGNVAHFMESIVWTSTLIVHYLRRDLNADSIHKTVDAMFLYGDNTYSKLPLTNSHRLIDAIVEYCENLLKYLIVRPDGTVSGATMAELEKMIGNGLKGTRWCLLTEREMLARSLVRNGIHKLKTRTEQNMMIRRAIRNAFVSFNSNVYRAIVGYLERHDSPLIRESNGETYLKDRTKTEIHKQKSEAVNTRYKGTKKASDHNRAKSIIAKLNAGTALGNADRIWMSRHPKMFKNPIKK